MKLCNGVRMIFGFLDKRKFSFKRIYLNLLKTSQQMVKSHESTLIKMQKLNSLKQWNII